MTEHQLTKRSGFWLHHIVQMDRREQQILELQQRIIDRNGKKKAFHIEEWKAFK